MTAGGDLSDEHEALRRTLRAYLAEHAPTEVVHEHDQAGRYPAAIVDGLAELGVFGATVQERYGGTETDATSVAVICEELQRAGGCIASAVTPTLTFCTPAIQRFGSDEQRAALLPDVAAGRTRMAIGLTEPDAASDLSTVAMRATPHAGGFDVSGTKVWCTGALEAEYVLALVRTDPASTGFDGLSLLLVPTGAEGVAVRKIPKLAAQGTASCEVFCDGAWVPGENLVGPLGGAKRTLWALLDSERVHVAAQCVGMAQAALDAAVAYASERRQFGRPVIEHQAVGHTLADMAGRVAAARLLAYDAVRRADAGVSYSREAALAKVTCSRLASDVVAQAMEVVGSYAYAVEYPFERLYREVKLFEIAGGTNHVLRTVIARGLQGGGSA